MWYQQSPVRGKLTQEVIRRPPTHTCEPRPRPVQVPRSSQQAETLPPAFNSNKCVVGAQCVSWGSWKATSGSATHPVSQACPGSSGVQPGF